MCGITGWFSPSPIDKQECFTLEKMVSSISHRGPDGSGTEIFNHAAFGHNRLSIIDLTGGQQPMFSHDKSLCIIFNGEIYNYQSLRKQLVDKGHQFNTNADTEVIMELYRQGGWQAFSGLRGMYAFALWDLNQQTGILVRDPLGIKPLFYSHKPGVSLTFGSEAKAILANGMAAQLDEAHLHLLLNFRYIPGDRSLFKDIQQLNPGQVLQWRINDEITCHKIQSTDIPALAPLDAIKDSIENHFVSDVEVAGYLSGGIDSACITIFGKQLSPNNYRTFTLKTGDDPNEAVNAANTANYLKVKNFQQSVPTNLETTLPRLLWHLETPKINALQVSELAKLTSQHVKVALSGLGGDELFYGYNAHRIFNQAFKTSERIPKPLTALTGRVTSKLLDIIQHTPWTEQQRAAQMLQTLGNWPRVYGLLRNVWDSVELRSQIYGPRMLDTQLPDAFNVLTELWPNESDPRIAMATFEWRNKMVNDLLWQEDRVSMAEGLEVRVPFVDNLLYQQIQRSCTHDLLNQTQPKQTMKTILIDTLPGEIINRPKSGFQVDSPSFFHSHLATLAKEWLSDEKINQYGLFNAQFVRGVLSKPVTKQLRWHYFILYFMLMTHMWVDIFEKQK